MKNGKRYLPTSSKNGKILVFQLNNNKNRKKNNKMNKKNKFKKKNKKKK